jgi:hypothetical protein
MYPQAQSTGQPPVIKPTNLIVLMAFIRDEEGNLQPAFEPREVQSEHKAKLDARRMAALGTYAGVITWSRSADLVNGEFGEPVIIFQDGDVPDMD